MEYYKLLQLEREPFSNSPDPNYFFQSRQHHACLQKLELAIRLKRGLNVVIGDMGTGKTTLCRELIRRLAQQETFETHLILDPSFSSGNEMLSSIYKMLYNRFPDGRPSSIDLKEAIKHALFDKGVYQKRTVVIIIDEGQKIPSPCVELLRELLNYETNEFKLLQIIIFAQKEFHAILQAHDNFADRINLLHQLLPMSFKDTRRMIRYRLKLASSGIKPLNLFSLPAQWAIYRGTRGYPRRIIHLCHQSLLTMIIQNRTRAGWKLIQSCRMRMRRPSDRTSLLKGWPAIVGIAVILVLSAPFFWRLLNSEQGLRRHYKVPQQTQETGLNSMTVADNAVNEPAPRQTAPSEPDGIPTRSDQSKADQQVMASLSPEGPEPTKMQPAPGMESSIATETNTLKDSVALPDKPEPPHPPTQLGRVTVKTGDTISGIVIQVYGNYRNDYVQAVLDVNPHIDDPDNIQLGESILLPAFDHKFKATSVDCHWVVFDRCQNLNEAIRISDTLTGTLKTATRPVALWSPEEGLYFEVLLQGYFENLKSAEIQTDLLPPEISQTARIISGWGDGTHIFSDPYAGGIRRMNHE